MSCELCNHYLQVELSTVIQYLINLRHPLYLVKHLNACSLVHAVLKIWQAELNKNYLDFEI